ncbi:hypothetical protein GO495_04290 [Chitinophaga oryziterrae]|uniref:Uncharacterized protein n=1 Tax=Chitinophaga oryziterrae TaxID=1031224 RepID=A0A6N8J6I7_9BACT|nr:hypothetical protein [Chitinophaga oryziterrae]MVT39792.1 hypothetical protein [Chitinophaga oryziterrae]
MTKAEFLDHTMPHQGIIYKVVNIYAEYKEDREDLLQEIWLATHKVPLYWMLGAILLSGISFYYLNVWYLHKRFGKRMLELKLLIAEFNEPDN